MGKLSILGNKRVEEFIKILKEKQLQEIESLNLPSQEAIIEMVDQNYGVAHLKKELAKLEEEIINKLGYDRNKVSRLSQYRPNYWEISPYAKEINKLTDQLINQPKREVEKKYKEKIEQLWFCETLEEAKEIVYGD